MNPVTLIFMSKLKKVRGPQIPLIKDLKRPSVSGWNQPGYTTKKVSGRYGQRLDNVTAVDVEREHFAGTDDEWANWIEKLKERCGYVVCARDDETSWHFYYGGEIPTATNKVKAHGVDCIKSGPGAYFIGAGSSGVFDGVTKTYRCVKNEPLTKLPKAFRKLAKGGTSLDKGTNYVDRECREIAKFIEREWGITLIDERSQLTGPCPKCGGTNRFNVHKNLMGLTMFCRQCVGSDGKPDQTASAAFIRARLAERRDEDRLARFGDKPPKEPSPGNGVLLDFTGEIEPVKCLFELGEVGIIPLNLPSVLVGDGGTGKTFMAIWMACEAIKKGMRVFWWDGEVGPKPFVKKVRAVEGAAETFNGNVTYFAERPDDAALASIDDNCFVVVDSMTRLGCPTDGSDASKWLKENLDPFRDRECTLVVIDHKSYTNNRDVKALVGAGSKTQYVQGSILEVVATEYFARGHSGELTLTVKKDNGGATGLPIGDVAAIVSVTDKCAWSIASGDGGSVHDAARVAQLGAKVNYRDKVVELIEASPDGWVNKGAVMGVLTGNKQAKSNLLDQYVANGDIVKRQEGRALMYGLKGTPVPEVASRKSANVKKKVSKQ